MSPSDSPGRDTAAEERIKPGFAQNTIERLFEFSPDAILVTDGDGVMRSANPRAEELFGYSSQELIGNPVEMLIPARFRGGHPRHRENYSAHPRTRQMGAALNLFGLRKDGTEFPVDIMLKPMQTAAGLAVVSFIRDATEQRAAQEALRINDLRLRSIVESIAEYAIYLLDRDGHVLTWNPGAEHIKGYKADEVLGLHFSRFFTQEDQERGRPAELLRQAAARGRVEEDGWRVRKDGSRFWANVVLTAIRDSTGAITGFAKVTRDMTDRKRAEGALIFQLSGALLADMDAGKLLEAISASIRDVIPHDNAGLVLHDAAGGDMVVRFLGSTGTDVFPGELRVSIDGSLSGIAFRTREPVLLESIANASYAPDTLSYLKQMGMQSGVWVPLVHHDKAIGALSVVSRQEGSFGQREVEMLVQIAGQVAMAVDNAMAFRRIAELRDRLDQEKQYLEDEINVEHRFDDIVGESTGLRNVLRQIETVAPTDATVLIQGETGTGKELLSRAIHRLSQRSEHTFIKLNCAAIPAGLLESELFGHEKGAFTGAIARKIGRLELAHEGTLFLDEVGDLPLDLQPKLLRALQEHEIERLGGTRPIPVNVRLIAATNRDLAKMVAEEAIPQRSFLSPQSLPRLRPAVARARRRHSRPRASLRFSPRPPHGQNHRNHPARGHGGACRMEVAGQHSRARELSGARRHPFPWAAAPCAASRA